MQPFREGEYKSVPLPIANIDTDRIIPARFLRKPRGTHGNYLFYDMRFGKDGEEKTDFPLNQVKYKNAEALVAAENFGCGSSRESAVWALFEFGFRCIIAPSFGDIFFSNCLKNGILPVKLPTGAVKRAVAELESENAPVLNVSLRSQTINIGTETEFTFNISKFSKQCLISGEEELAITFQKAREMNNFLEKYRKDYPWNIL